MHREETYRAYVTDSLKLQATGQAFVTRWQDLVKSRPKRSEKTPEQIITDTIAKGGLNII